MLNKNSNEYYDIALKQFSGFHTGAQDYYGHSHEFIKGLTIPSLSVRGYDFWNNEEVAPEYTGQYATNIFVEQAEEIIDRHAKTKV